MLKTYATGSGGVTVFFLHMLAVSGRGWEKTVERLAGEFRCVVVDLPGFGGSADVNGYSVAEMAEQVREVIRAEDSARWMLVGHSMGAKVSAVVARAAEDNQAGLAGLRGIVLLAGSPPGPEPMGDKRRESMRGWFAGDREKSRSEAAKFIDNNSAHEFPRAEKDALVDLVLQMDRLAWLSWLDAGSREDWSRRVGVLRTPTLIVAGEKDPDLGPDGQRSLMLPHFSAGSVHVLSGAKHLLPMERPDEVAALIANHARLAPAAETAAAAPLPGPDYRKLLDSGRVSAATRRVLEARALPDDPAYEPQVLNLEELATLRAVVARIIPQPAEAEIDIAARIDRQLAGPGDGWRNAALPPDPQAYQAALLTLDHEAQSAYGSRFGTLDAEQQDALLTKASKGGLGSGFVHEAAAAVGLAKAAQGLTAAQMKLWFHDLCADATRIYVAHPATLERMGYGGFADGADASTAQGFTQIGAGQREPSEPAGKQTYPQ